jgi:hypothetical protein
MEMSLEDYRQQKMAGAFGCCAIGTCTDPYCDICVRMVQQFGASPPIRDRISKRDEKNPTRSGLLMPGDKKHVKSKRKTLR